MGHVHRRSVENLRASFGMVSRGRFVSSLPLINLFGHLFTSASTRGCLFYTRAVNISVWDVGVGVRLVPPAPGRHPRSRPRPGSLSPPRHRDTPVPSLRRPQTWSLRPGAWVRQRRSRRDPRGRPRVHESPGRAHTLCRGRADCSPVAEVASHAWVQRGSRAVCLAPRGPRRPGLLFSNLHTLGLLPVWSRAKGPPATGTAP